MPRATSAWAGLGVTVALAALGFLTAYFLCGWGLSRSPRRASYRLVEYWTEAGSRPLDQPYGIAVDPRNGNVFVSDAKNQRVVVFSATGRFLRQFGRKGKGPGEFDLPTGMAVGPDSSVYVADYNLDRIQRFSETGKLLSLWGGEKGPSFNSPVGLALDHQGRLFAADFWDKVVKVLDPDGRLERTIGRPGQFGSGRLDYPSDVDVLPDGRVLVADTYNYRIQLFDADGRPVKAWGWHLFWFFPRPNAGDKGFSEVTSVVFDDKQNVIHATDSLNQRVVMLDIEGRFISDWRVPNAKPYLGTPMEVALSPDGKRLYATDIIGNRIIVLEQQHGPSEAAR